MKLTKKQTKAIDFLEDDITEELLYGGAAGGGKSALGCYWQIKRRLKYPGTRGCIGRSELKTLKKTTLKTFFEIASKQQLRSGVHYTFNSQDSTIYFYNNSEIILADLFTYPSDPEFDSLGSLELTDAFIDECGQVSAKGKSVLKSRIRFRIKELDLVPKVFMSCNPVKTWPYHEFYKPSREGVLPDFRKFVAALPKDNPHLPDSYLLSLSRLDKTSRERLLEGNWEYDDDPSALIDYDAIINSFNNSYLLGGERFISADVARFGRDSSVIAVWNGFRVKLYQYKGKSVTQIAGIIKDFQTKLQIPTQNIVVDDDGVGGGVVDILGCKGFVNNSRPLQDLNTGETENYANLKSQCYFKLADIINKGKLFIDSDDSTVRTAIIEELEQVKQYEMDKDRKKQVLPKDKVKEIIGRSPDFSDALMMRLVFELSFKFKVVVA